MLRISIFNIFIVCVILLFSTVLLSKDKYNKSSSILLPLTHLFSHQKHKESFTDYNIVCQDCHPFSIMGTGTGPLAKEVTSKILRPQKEICHKCHLEKVELPHPNQCSLCHIDPKSLKPADHNINWERRHGQLSQIDRDTCSKCHKRNECTVCHLQRDVMNRKVHKGNFRLTHSIEARTRPDKCTICHLSQRFCIDCHSGVRK